MKKTRTRFKLAEAQFFLTHVEQRWRHIPDVDFYLSAFISAARSVTWVMRYEYHKRIGWEDWYESKKPPPELRDLLKKMNDLRIRAVKTDPIRTRTTAKLSIPPEQITPAVLKFLQDNPGFTFKIHPTDSSNTEAHLIVGDRILATARIEHTEHEIPEFEGRDAKDVCRKYLVNLEILVDDCEKLFGP